MPNIARNCIINIGETVVYDAVKDGLISGGLMKDGIKCHLASAVVAGVTATLVASPVDVVKTRWVPTGRWMWVEFFSRYMNAERGRYRGAIHCAANTFRVEGVR